jgi:hypothetical protein
VRHNCCGWRALCAGELIDGDSGQAIHTACRWEHSYYLLEKSVSAAVPGGDESTHVRAVARACTVGVKGIDCQLVGL